MSAAVTILNPFEIFRAYVRQVPDGAKLGWVDIEKATGISVAATPVNYELRRLFRRACKKEGRVAVAIGQGWGIEFSSASNAVDFTHRDVIRIANSTQRGHKRAGRLLEKHGEEMTEDNRRKLIASGAFYGTVQLAVSATLGTKPKMPVTKPPAPMLPFTKKEKT
jgi:hypothetical protein